MKRPPGWLVWLSLFLGVLPLAVDYFLDNAYMSGFISNRAYLGGNRLFYILGYPAMSLSSLMQDIAAFWQTELDAAEYFRAFGLFVILNSVGWLLIVGTARAILNRIRTIAVVGSRPPTTPPAT